MRETEYSEAAVEVLDILNYTDKEDVARIPQSFIKFLTDISNKNYKVKFNHEQPVGGLNLRKQTKELLGFIYITWWCNKEEREEYKKLIHNNNIKKEEIYNINDIFKNKNLTHQHNQRLWVDTPEPFCLRNRKENKEHSIIKNESVVGTSIVEYKKENIFKKFLNKILSFFSIKKGDKI